MRIAIHDRLQLELEEVANRGFAYEAAIGMTVGMIDDLFVEAPPDADLNDNWNLLPYADSTKLSRKLDLRCIDSDAGLVTVICTVRSGVLYLLSAGLATKAGRAVAITAAVERVSDLSWAMPE